MRSCSSFSQFPVSRSAPSTEVITNINVQYLGDYFGIRSFSDTDIKDAFAKLSSSGSLAESESYVTEESVAQYINQRFDHMSTDDRDIMCRSLMYELACDSSSLTAAKSVSDYTRMLSSRPVMHTTEHIANYPKDFDMRVDYPAFASKIRQIGENIDIRVWPVALSNTCKCAYGIVAVRLCVCLFQFVSLVRVSNLFTNYYDL